MKQVAPARGIQLTGWAAVAIGVGAIAATLDFLAAGAGVPSVFGGVASVIAALGGATLLWRWEPRLRPALDRVGAALLRTDPVVFLAAVLAVGVALRVAWCLACSPAQTTDYGVYFDLARRVARGAGYFDPGPPANHAFWPPGYPLLLAGPMWLTDGAAWTPLALNLGLFAVAVVATHALGVRGGLPAAGRFAAIALAVWPNLVAYSGLAAKEHLSLALLPLALLGWLVGRRVHTLLAVGLAVGYLALAQGTWLLLPGVLAVYGLLSGDRWRTVLRRVAPVLVGMALVIGPWAARNAVVLHAPVLLTTNAGPNLHRGNREGARGDYSPMAADALPGKDELERSRRGRDLAIGWMRAHPLEVVGLSFAKMGFLLGDDTNSLYDALRHPYGVDDTVYAALKIGFTLFWLCIWALVLLAIARAGPEALARSWLLLPLLCLLNLMAVHSIFHAIGRFHVPIAGVLALLAGWAFSRGARPEARPRAGGDQRPTA